jgi:hypothetical protein
MLRIIKIKKWMIKVETGTEPKTDYMEGQK